MNLTLCPVGEFKARFSEMLDHVRKGGSVVVTYGREKVPVAILQPPTAKPKRKLGFLSGKMKVVFKPNWKMTDEEFLNP